ncbi:MAG: hypothetical protein P8177_11420 [Gemmatimonadota bacterium]
MAEQARIAETFHLRAVLGDSVWPGWGDAQNPQIVYNDRYAFLVGYDGEPPAGWFREPAHEQLGGPWVRLPDLRVVDRPVYRTELPRGVSPQAFAVRVGDRWVGSIPTLEWARLSLREEVGRAVPPPLSWIPPYRIIGPLLFRGPQHHVALTLHESFHAFQGQQAPERFAFAEKLTRLEDSYPQDGAIKALWEEELAALAEGLESSNGQDAAGCTRQFLELRARRRADLGPDLIELERQREWLEGLAKYVEVRTWLLADRTASYQPLDAAQQALAPADYSEADEALGREIAQLRRSAGQGGTLFYYSGMAQAMLLDRLSPGWKVAAFEEGATLEGLLARAVAFTPPAP